MKKTEKRLFAFSIAAAMLFVMPSSASAMHIMEGYLPMGHAIAWGALCLPFLVAGFISIKKTISQHRKALLILAMAGAYPAVGDSVAEILEEMGLESVGAPGTTAALALLNDHVKKGGVMASITTFMGIFAVTQIPLAIVEGLLSVVVILALESYASSELGELAYSQY